MIIIGEKLNSSIPSTQSVMNARDTCAIRALIENQVALGANYIDINTAVCNNELEDMLWILGIAAEVIKGCDCGIMIDTTSEKVAAAAAEFLFDKNVPMILNSITVTDRFDTFLPIVKKYGTGVVCLPIGDEGIPMTVAERVENGGIIIGRLKDAGIEENRIYIDAIVEALATGEDNPSITLDTISMIKAKFPSVYTVCGLSNISFGLPRRICLNTAFLAMAVYSGLNAAIMDITSKPMRDALYAVEALCGRDEYCMNYIDYMRE